MKVKFLFYTIIVTGIILCIVILCIKCIEKYKTNEINEYIPQEEISEEQERQTLVTLFFQNSETMELMPEARLIDVKQLIEKPYETLVNLLIEGPKNDKLQLLIPEGTKLNTITKDKNTAIIDFSTEFKNINLGKDQEEKIVYSIVNTLTELAEIDFVKILIDGQDGLAFEDEAVNFVNEFSRID